MSFVSTYIHENTSVYLQNLIGEPSHFRALRLAALEEDIEPIQIASEQRKALQVLLKVANAKSVVEVGTLFGYSAFTMAEALPQDGQVKTIEVCPKCMAFARSWSKKMPEGHKVQFIEGDATKVLKTLKTHEADAIFIDGDKPQYQNLVQESMRVVKPGGLILVDNAFAFGHVADEFHEDPNVQAIQAFNQWVIKHPALEGSILPTGDGMWVLQNKST